MLIVLLLLVAAAVGVYVLWPLLARERAEAGPDAAPVALAVLRERRRELDASIGHLPPDSAERRAALAEFAALAEVELPDTGARAATMRTVRRPWSAAIIGALLLVPSFGLYLLAGAPEAASPEFRAAREPATLDELATDVRRRLLSDPKSAEGWRMLGRVEVARGRPEDAREAFERALALAPDDVQTKVDYADAIAQAQGAVLAGRPIALVREALAADPRHPKALALAGAYEVTQRNFAGALVHWKALLQVLPPDSEQASQIAGFVADLEAGRPPQVHRAAPPAAAVAPPGSGPPAAGTEPAAAAPPAGTVGPAAASGPTTLQGRIEIERSLAARLQPDDTVFVVARTLDDQGRPVGPPVAVLRARGADLPLVFTLDDRMAMSPAARLSAVPPETRVVVIARVSRSGEAAARSGDLQGASAPVRPGAAGLRVLLDTVVD
jgi:cytochrome c-type biogenesis protein CcmH